MTCFRCNFFHLVAVKIFDFFNWYIYFVTINFITITASKSYILPLFNPYLCTNYMKRIKAKKSFGQHFLIDERISRSIGYALERKEEIKNVLEIGPGKGVLTKYLLEQDIILRVVEADRDMVSYLQENFHFDEDQIIFLDFLKLNLSKVFDGQPFYLIGNYPYNISSQILIKMVDYYQLVPEMVGMFQKEVADRVIAPSGSKTYGSISAIVQLFYEGEEILFVPPESFAPPPKVDSSVIRLKRRTDIVYDFDIKLYRKVVRAAFSQRRKMLRNTLKPFLQNDVVFEEELLTKRPEHLSVKDFIFITKKIERIL